MTTITADFRLYAALVAVLLLVTAGIAIAFGYISHDSWYYIQIADNLRHGHGCSSGGEYMAIYPCGYPAVLAATAPVATLPGFMISSKITNLLLLMGSFWFVFKASRHVLMATLLILNPVTLNLFMYTWSENLLLFCFCGTVFAFRAIVDHPEKLWPLAVLAAVLVLGCFARYFFGPFAFILFVCGALAFGWRPALRALPAFVIAGAVFIGYQMFNIHMTGHGTGMARTTAPEAPLYLLRQFAGAAFYNGLMIAIAGVLLVGLSLKQWRVERKSRDAVATFVLLAGIGFLLLALYLRLRTQFDPFNTRTIGYGLVLIAAGLTGRFIQPKSGNPDYAFLPLLACGVFSIVFADGIEIPRDIHDLPDGGYSFPPAAFDQLRRHGPHYETIVYFRLPASPLDSANIDNIEDIYYGDDVSLVSPAQWPDPRDTAGSFLRKLADEDTDSCIFDFTAFSDLNDLKVFLDGSVVLDHRFWPRPGAPGEVRTPVFDPSLKTYLLSVAQPGKEVPCSDILSLPQTKNALAMP